MAWSRTVTAFATVTSRTTSVAIVCAALAVTTPPTSTASTNRSVSELSAPPSRPSRISGGFIETSPALTENAMRTEAGDALVTRESSPSSAASAARVSSAPPVLRLHGVVEPVKSHSVSAPRLTGAAPGSAPGQLVVVRLARPGTFVRKGELLVEFDRSAQLKAARDREAEYQDMVAQIEKKRAEQSGARAERVLNLTLAENAVRRAELDVLGNDLVANIVAEKNVQALEEARAHLSALKTSMDLQERAEVADVQMLDVQRARAKSAWDHATRNAEKMLIVSPLDGLVVLKAIWKTGTMAEVQEGEDVRPGIPILEVVNPAAMRIRVLVNQADVTHLAPGQSARITLDSHPSRQFQGRLEHLSPVAMTSALSTRVRTCLATFSIEGQDEHLLPDLAAAVDVVLDTSDASSDHQQ